MLVGRVCLAAVCFVCILPVAARSESDALHVDLGNHFNLELVEIAPGSFMQGSAADELGHRPDEMQHEVRLRKKFYLGRTPVTRGQFARFAEETGYRTEAEAGASGGFGWSGTALVQRKDFTWKNPGFAQTDNDPVTVVTYGDACAFLKWLTEKTGRQFQLPTEAQWEYACRAGTKTPWPNGTDPAGCDAQAWNKSNAGNGTHPVGQKTPNAWGLYDMLGNVWEWCDDWYGPYGSGLAVDPLQENPNVSDKPRRVLRGGSWLRDRMDCRAPARYRNDPGSRNADNGFRVETESPVKAEPSIPVERASGNVSRPSHMTDANRFAELRTRLVAQGGEVHAGIAEAGLGSVIVILVIVVIVFSLLRSLFTRGFGGGVGMPGGSVFISGPFSIRVGNDGFWISGNFPAGTPLICRYDAGAGMQETQLLFEPGPEGQFVYTGSRPSNVTVVVQNGPPQRPVDVDADADLLLGNLPPTLPPARVSPPPPPPAYSGPPPAY